MLRAFIGIGAASIMSTIAVPVRAESPAEGFATGRVIVGIERAMPILTYAAMSNTPNGSTVTTTQTRVSIGLVTGDPLGILQAFYVVPRLAIDVVAAPHFTIGGSAWVNTFLSNSQSTSGSSMSQDLSKPTYWGVAPRLGYILPISELVAFWPRAGVEYHSFATTTTNNSQGASLQQVAADVEASFVITPVHHLGFNLQVYGAIPISGSSQSGNNPSTDISELAVGLTFGMLGWF